ncbi:hypothetical protein Y032_0014g2361 [Ancylostoma ceylanicum]|nr:hypothetical protein Y032_0014g2361 [Ancylostoma ceylanicum]
MPLCAYDPKRAREHYDVVQIINYLEEFRLHLAVGRKGAGKRGGDGTLSVNLVRIVVKPRPCTSCTHGIVTGRQSSSRRSQPYIIDLLLSFEKCRRNKERKKG